MSDLSPLDVLYDRAVGSDVALPAALHDFYGPLSISSHDERPHVIANFVESLDGVVALEDGAHAGGDPIGGSNKHDRAVMGLLRAIADVVVVGAGTLRSVPRHFWTPYHVFGGLSDAYRELRQSLGKPEHPTNVIVTASGMLDGSYAILEQDEIPVAVLTTTSGADAATNRLSKTKTSIIVGTNAQALNARDIVDAVQHLSRPDVVLLETGPTLTTVFLAERMLDELFLTMAPQVAGRTANSRRLSFAEGKAFAPDDPYWSTLTSVRQAGSFLFLRYLFRGEDAQPSA